MFVPEDQGVTVMYFEIPRADEALKEKDPANIRFRVTFVEKADLGVPRFLTKKFIS